MTHGTDIIEGIHAWTESAEPEQIPAQVLHETGVREQWLAEAVTALRPMLAELTGIIIPAVRVGVGFPSSGERSAVRGECWIRAMSADGVNEIIMRITHHASVVAILGTLAHEMLHAGLDCQDGHSGRFAKASKAFGFSLAITSEQKTPECHERLSALAERLGIYPGMDGLRERGEGGSALLGGALTGAGKRVSSGPRKQGTRMLRCECDVCGFAFRTTRKWLDAAPNLRCPDAECSGWMRTEA